MDNLFAPHALNPTGISKLDYIHEHFQTLLSAIEVAAGSQEAPFCNAREMAIVRTKLQEASFFAVRAAALVPENQK